MLNPEIQDYSMDDVMMALSIFDENNDGKLSITELQHAMTHFGEDIDERQGGGNTKMNQEEF